MKNIFIKPTETTPEIKFDFQKGQFEISGVSYPEFAREFYEPLLDALEKYVENPSVKITEMAFKFTYFNTGTNTLISGILSALEQLVSNGYQVRLQWYYEEEDEDMKELGEYFKTLTKLPLEFIACDEIS